MKKKPKTIRWLETYSVEFKRLRPKERRAISDFALLWMFFEAAAFEAEADQGLIRGFAKNLSDAGLGPEPSFEDAVVYYRDRFWSVGGPTNHFHGLDPRSRLSANNRRLLIEGLSDPNAAPETVLSMLFVIVFRLRNNLFQGEKATYGFADQHDNLTRASAVLMRALELLKTHPHLRP
jgi:hypothetical protein